MHILSAVYRINTFDSLFCIFVWMANEQPQQVPREAKMAALLLSAAGVAECEPRVVQQMIEFMYRYSTDVLQEAAQLAEHAGKTEVDTDDLRLAVRSQLRHMFVQPPARDFMMEMAARRNAIPLPPCDDAGYGPRIPSDSSTLLGASYRVTSQRRPLSSDGRPDQHGSPQKRRLAEP